VSEVAGSARYRFGDAARSGVLLGLPVRQSLPLIGGVVWLTVWLVAHQPLVGMAGLTLGAAGAFGRWRRAPLYEVAVPGVRLAWKRLTRTGPWVRSSLLAEGPGCDDELPPPLAGLELVDHDIDWHGQQGSVAVVRDGHAGSVSVVLPVRGIGFPVASPHEQDGLLAGWGAALAPLARARGPVARLVWQEWAHPVGVADHREFLASLDRRQSLVASAIEVLCEEARLLAARLTSAGLRVEAPLSPPELSTAIRLRSDPSRAGHVDSLRRSLAAAAGRGTVEWGPMAVEAGWFHTRVDGAVHRSYRVAAWPMLPVAADWLAPLLAGDGATRTVTVVLEPVPLARAAAEANRQLTSIESDHAQKQRHGFRLTARERRRQVDIEGRERELAEGHPEFRHVGLVTVTAGDVDALEEACARVEQTAAASMLDLRPLAGRQSEGWVASLPVGRSVKPGGGR
jgi:hypothetical protein